MAIVILIALCACGGHASTSNDAGNPGWWALCKKWNYSRYYNPINQKWDWYSVCVEWK